MKKTALLIFFFSLSIALFSYFGRIRNYQDYVLKPKSTESKSYKVNLNLANNRELENIPSIGPSLAQRILIYRKEIGGFKNINEIKNVKGIGDKTFNKIKIYLEV